MEGDLKYFLNGRRPQIFCNMRKTLNTFLNIFPWKTTINMIILRQSQTLASKALPELGTDLPQLVINFSPFVSIFHWVMWKSLKMLDFVKILHCKNIFSGRRKNESTQIWDTNQTWCNMQKPCLGKLKGVRNCLVLKEKLRDALQGRRVTTFLLFPCKHIMF